MSPTKPSHFGTRRARGTRASAAIWSAFVILTILTGVFPAKMEAAPAFRAPRPDQALQTLKPDHPRLMLDQATPGNIRKWTAADPVADRIHRSVLASAKRALGTKPAVYELRDGRRLLYVSSEVQQRVGALAYAFRMTGDKAYVERAWADLHAAAGFKDWNPAHFLDTAVMTAALAIGYDWLWDQWTPAQRQELRDAIVRLGLQPAMKVYSGKRGWHTVDYNWNQVCNGGIAMGALAVAEDQPEIAAKVIHHAVASIPRAMKAYAPDGGGKEGAGYWAFGSQYNVMLLASLRSALGTDFGLAEIDGFKQSGFYQIYSAGAGRKSFDFSDCKLSPLSAPQHFWMGRHYRIPEFSRFRHDALRATGGGLWDLLWFDPDAAKARVGQLPPDRHFRGAEFASMRDSWDDAKGFIVAMQGGSNRWTHRHHDLGSFILEADGVRWIIDSGRESQTYHRGINKTPRGDFYRVRAEGHNTLVINPDKDPGQSAAALAKFAKFESTASTATAVLDLGEAYQDDATSVRRSFELARGRRFTVSDEITCRKPAEVWSFFHTQAEVALSADKRRAILKQAGKTLVAELLAPAGATLQVLPAEPASTSPNPAKQASNKGRRKLAVHLKDVSSARIQLAFSLPAADQQVH